MSRPMIAVCGCDMRYGCIHVVKPNPLEVKLESWRGRYPFPPDPNAPTRVLRCDLKRYSKW